MVTLIVILMTRVRLTRIVIHTRTTRVVPITVTILRVLRLTTRVRLIPTPLHTKEIT